MSIESSLSIFHSRYCINWADNSSVSCKDAAQRGTFVHKWQKPGTFAVKVSASNEVSEETITKTITITATTKCERTNDVDALITNSEEDIETVCTGVGEGYTVNYTIQINKENEKRVFHTAIFWNTPITFNEYVHMSYR